jgi:GTP:adenosylcobinamide-phosphate guanylyltransferase
MIRLEYQTTAQKGRSMASEQTSATNLPERDNGTAAESYTAVVLAGSRSSHDPVASLFGGHYKALVPVVGRPMVARVVQSLMESATIDSIAIVFDDENALTEACPEFLSEPYSSKISVHPCGKTICGSVERVIDATGSQWPYLITTADHALLTPEMVDDFGEMARIDSDVAIGMVEKKHIVAMHPSSKRTYLPFRDTKLSGANLFAFTGPSAVKAIRFWKKIEQERKKPWKLFAAFGVTNLIGLSLKLFTVEKAFAKASKKLGAKAKAVLLPYAEAAIDVDKPKDYTQVTEILEQRAE